MKLSSYKKGLFAEYFCMLYLFFYGYRILAHRYKTHIGEIDIIAKRGKTIIFIEVKARKNITDGKEAILNKSKYRIENTAKLWLAKAGNYNFNQQRFDVLVVTSFYKKPKWYKNAWQMG